MVNTKSNSRSSSNIGEKNEVAQSPDRISAYFKDKVLLITGGTGFMGKVLVEKILRTCDVKMIYLLTRNKKGKNSQSRIRAICSSPLFHLLKEMKGEDIMKKVVAISGDVTLTGLGLSDENRKLLAKEVNIIYHFAATVRFTDSIKTAVIMNARGTQLMLELAKECSKLEVFVHASTAYCHLNEKILYEKPYPPPADPQTVLKLIDWLEDDTIELVKHRILGDEPNTYTFSKAIGESIAVEAMDSLPVVILRFPIVVSTWKEPVRGWTDNINGPVGLFVAAGKGVLRTMYCDATTYADFLPVDVAANFTMAFTYNYELFKERRIYNCTTSDKLKATWGNIIDIGKKVVTTKMPFNGSMWYPDGSMTRSKLVYWICVILFHYLPVLILDPLIWLSGNKPILWRVQQRLTKSIEVLEYFSNNQWIFDNECARKANSWMNDTERVRYNVDVTDLNVEEFIFNFLHGARLYLLNEADDTIPSAKAHLKRMWLLDRVCKVLIVFGLIYFVSKKIFQLW